MNHQTKFKPSSAVTHNASPRKIKEIQSKGAQVLVYGNGRVNLRNLFQQLEKMGLKKIIVEGGGEINWSVLKLASCQRISCDNIASRDWWKRCKNIG